MTEDIRMAILTPFGPSHPRGGVEVFNECLRRSFGEIAIFADGGMGSAERFGDLRRVGLEQPVGALRAARSLLREHRRTPFDVILSNGVYGWPLTLARPDVPMVQVYHFTMAGLARQALTLPGDRLTTGHVTALFDRIAGVGKHVVAVSEKVLGEIEAFYGLHGRLLRHAVDTRTFRPTNPARARDALGIPQGIPAGLFVGRPDSTKGYDILLRVAQRMPHVLFLVIGGSEGKRGNVWSIGQVLREDLPLWYSAADFFISPSRYEGFGLALLEALSCDLPAVVSAQAWPFTDGAAQCGIVVAGEADEDWLRGIHAVLADRARFAPREFVHPRYDFAVFQRSWGAFVKSLLENGA